MSSPNSANTNLKKLLQAIRSPAELATFFKESSHIQSLLKKLPGYVGISILVLVLYSAALLTWKLIPVPILPAPASSSLAVNNDSAATVNRFTAHQMAQWSLFGKANSKIRKTVVKTTTIVRETNVKIGLIGIIASLHKHENRIIISNGRSRDKLYKTGAILPGNIRIESIHRNHVILIINSNRVRKTLKTVEAREARQAQQKKKKNSQKNN
ncbi:hypothetical protein MNBD_GAMMA12-3359 [hydrothermal vent metagenome]|uniref:Type II secretion system protein GspC N-terminal domain-containing protein n=1 Tax=hydrothermal vent metagenome TaxID=652676 RepID=A0A3B0YAU0_9ZZZZ